MGTDDNVEAVLQVVESIPRGRVMSYGMIAAYVNEVVGLRIGVRQVGRVLAHHGGAVPWHRVVGADGRLPAPHAVAARAQLIAEGVPFRGERVAMNRAQWWPG